MSQYKNTLPMPIKARPYYHQTQIFDFVCWLFGLLDNTFRSAGAAILAEMGTGKTMCAIAMAGILYQLGLIKSVLIVCPLTLTSVWEDEFSKFADFPFTLTVLNGSSSKKKQTLSALDKNDFNIVVINYESSWRLLDELLAFAPDLTICDEGHKIKEGRSKQSKAMHDIGDVSKYKLLLTGTLITNKEIDVFSQYRFINKDIFGTSFYRYRSRYFDMKGYGNHTPVFREVMQDEFLQKLHSIAFRVRKEDCLDLPEIREEVRKVRLEPKAEKLYDSVLQESYAELEKGEVSTPNVLTRLLRLSQITGGFVTDDDGNVSAVSTAKLEALSDLIDEAMEENQKLVIMARFVAELDAIEEMLAKKHIGYSVIRGGIKDRDSQIKRFQNDADCMVFLGQISAAGLGLTLTAASTMIFYSLNYSMSDFEQAKARIHRVSQKNDCRYIYLSCVGTVDTKVLKALRDKVDLAKMLIDDYRKGLNPYKEN